MNLLSFIFALISSTHHPLFLYIVAIILSLTCHPPSSSHFYIRFWFRAKLLSEQFGKKSIYICGFSATAFTTQISFLHYPLTLSAAVLFNARYYFFSYVS
ncbi:unnamed protein product [Meloidogyne enterolobii]|uniref:Uncharacterized protein n=1 Tax=Meloidogyne enterolobii TaxID=390850 RepID=A0ACB1AKC2_MELEN